NVELSDRRLRSAQRQRSRSCVHGVRERLFPGLRRICVTGDVGGTRATVRATVHECLHRRLVERPLLPKQHPIHDCVLDQRMAKPELIRRFFYEDRGVNELTERSRENRLVNSRHFIYTSCFETLTEYC